MELGKFILFIHRKLTGDLDKEESYAPPEWSGDEDLARVEREVSRIWSAGASYKKGYQPDVDKAWNSFSAKLAAERRPSPALRAVRRRLAFAAAVLFLILAGALWRTQVRSNERLQTIATAGNERRAITLPDETKVILNQNSKLSYPGQWDEDTLRLVQLSGEAYFEVRPDGRRAFQVETERAMIRVLGTAFNLRAYPDENYTEAAVTEGRVRLSGKYSSQQAVILTQDQVGRLDHGDNTVKIIPHTALNSQFWRTNRLSFRNAPMLEIAQALERHFGVDIRFESVALSQCAYNFNYTGESLEEMLEIFKLSLRLTIDRTGEHTYLISGGDCVGAD